MMHGREMSCHAASSCLIQRKHLTKRDPWKLLAFPASFPVSLPTRFPFFFLPRAYPLSPEMLPNDLSSTLVHFHIFPSLFFFALLHATTVGANSRSAYPQRGHFHRSVPARPLRKNIPLSTPQASLDAGLFHAKIKFSSHQAKVCSRVQQPDTHTL